MPMQKKDPPCSNAEFAIRRQVAGLDNATLKELGGFSISAMTKWNAGGLPVSWQAYRILERVEKAIENEIVRITEEIEDRLESEPDLAELEPFAADWPYGSSTYAVALVRARRAIEDILGRDMRIKPLPERIAAQHV